VVCPTCNAELKKLEKQIQDFMKLATDSCTAAKALVNTAGDALADAEANSCVQYVMGQGDTDPDDARKVCLSMPSSDSGSYSGLTIAQNLETAMHGANGANGQKPQQFVPGAATVAIVTTCVNNGTCSSGSTGNNMGSDDIGLATSLLGTWVRSVPGIQNGAVVSSTDASGNGLPTPVVSWKEPTITLKDILYGNSSATCLIPNTSDVYTDVSKQPCNIQGTLKDYQTNIAALITAVKNGSDISQINATDSQGSVTGTLADFVNGSSAPILALVQATMSDPGSQATTTEMAAEFMALLDAKEIIENYAKVVKDNCGVQAVDDPKKIVDSINALEDQLYKEVSHQLDLYRVAMAMYNMTDFFDKAMRTRWQGNMNGLRVTKK